MVEAFEAVQAELLRALEHFSLGALNHDQKLVKLRALAVSFVRQGRPDERVVQREIDQLSPYFPPGNKELDRELCELMLYLDAPGAVSNTVALLKHAAAREDQMYYMMRLRTMTHGWTRETRQACLAWFANPQPAPPRPETLRIFQDVNLPYADGSDLQAYLDDFRSEFAVAAGLSTNELLPVIQEPAGVAVSRQPQANHAFVKNWKSEDFFSMSGAPATSSSIARGKAAFVNGQCVLCHRFNGVGGVAGPDLTAVSSRMMPREILQSIFELSKTIADAYKNTTLYLTDGDVLCGRVVERTADKLTLMTDIIHQTTVEIRTREIQSQRLSNISPMPEGLLNSMTEHEIWDLLNYLQSGSLPYAQAKD